MRCSHYSESEGYCKKKGNNSSNGRNVPWWKEGMCKGHWILKHGGTDTYIKPSTRGATWHTVCERCGKTMETARLLKVGYCSEACRGRIYQRRKIHRDWMKRFMVGIKLWATITG